MISTNGMRLAARMAADERDLELQAQAWEALAAMATRAAKHLRYKEFLFSPQEMGDLKAEYARLHGEAPKFLICQADVPGHCHALYELREKEPAQ